MQDMEDTIYKFKRLQQSGASKSDAEDHLAQLPSKHRTSSSPMHVHAGGAPWGRRAALGPAALHRCQLLLLVQKDARWNLRPGAAPPAPAVAGRAGGGGACPSGARWGRRAVCAALRAVDVSCCCDYILGSRWNLRLGTTPPARPTSRGVATWQHHRGGAGGVGPRGVHLRPPFIPWCSRWEAGMQWGSGAGEGRRSPWATRPDHSVAVRWTRERGRWTRPRHSEGTWRTAGRPATRPVG